MNPTKAYQEITQLDIFTSNLLPVLFTTSNLYSGLELECDPHFNNMKKIHK